MKSLIKEFNEKSGKYVSWQTVTLCLFICLSYLSIKFLKVYGEVTLFVLQVILLAIFVGSIFLISKKRNDLEKKFSEEIINRETILHILAEGQPGMFERLFGCEKGGFPVLEILKEIKRKILLKEYKEYLNMRYQSYKSILFKIEGTDNRSYNSANPEVVEQMDLIKLLPTWKEMMNNGEVPSDEDYMIITSVTVSLQ